jgi:hypothetical protein
VYADDVLVVSRDSQDVMNEMGKRYNLKPGSVREPTEYLGTTIGKYIIATETELEASLKDVWSMSCDQLVKHVVTDIELE